MRHWLAALLVLGTVASLAHAAPGARGGKKATAAVASAPAAAAPAPRVVILLRHGHYASDPAANPDLGPGLTPLGVAQAHLAGARLAAFPTRVDEIFASPLTRAQDTAKVVAADLGATSIVTIQELAECTPPSAHLEPVKPELEAEMQACAARLDRVFAEHFRPAEGKERRELLVCHGNVIRYLVMKSLHVDPTAWLGMSVGHTSLTTIRIGPDGTTQVIGTGDVGHLPPNLLTGTSNDPERALAVPRTP